MNQENRFTSFTTCGMPIEFEALHRGSKRTIPVGSIEWFADGTILINSDIPLSEVILRQRIKATSSDDPPQELYLGDVVRIKLEKNNITAVIVWHNLSVCLKFREEGKIVYYGLGDFFRSGVGKIKKLGSRYTEEGKEILKKAGLEGKR